MENYKEQKIIKIDNKKHHQYYNFDHSKKPMELIVLVNDSVVFDYYNRLSTHTVCIESDYYWKSG